MPLDPKEVVPSDYSIDVTEGSTAAYSVSLADTPSGDVTVAVASSDTSAVTVSPASLGFTVDNYAVAQTVTVTAVDNSSIEANASVVISNTATGGGYSDVAAASVDVAVGNDDKALVVTADQHEQVFIDELVINEGDYSRYGLRLTAAPLSAVTVAVSSADTANAGVSPASLTFDASNWNKRQYVGVSAIDNADVDGEVQVVVSNTASGGGYDTLSVELTATIVDDEKANAAPVFAVDEVTVNVNEKQPVGTLVTTAQATDVDGDALTYHSSGSQPFAVDSTTGRITTTEVLNANDNYGRYIYNVYALDNRGGRDNLTVNVVVDSTDNLGVVTVAPTDPQVGVTMTATLSDDDDLFNGTLAWRWHFINGSTPKTGTPQPIAGATSNTYTPTLDLWDHVLTVTASYDDAHGAAKTVTVVLGAVTGPDNTPGVITLTPDSLRVGETTTATLSDDDGVSGWVTWKWYTDAGSPGTQEGIVGANSASYMPLPSQFGHVLTVVARYFDANDIGDDQEATAVVGTVTSNQHYPEFDGQWTTRTVAENQPAGTNVGAPVIATDGDGDTVTYELEDDTVPFAVDATTGQITTTRNTRRVHQSPLHGWA